MALVCLALLFLPTVYAFSETPASDYLCELGKEAYTQGKTEEALSDFNKALLIDPKNKEARVYIDKIFKENLNKENSVNEIPPPETPSVESPVVNPVPENESPAVKNAVTQMPLAADTLPRDSQIQSPRIQVPASQVQPEKILTKDEIMEQELLRANQESVVTNSYNDADLAPKDKKSKKEEDERGIKMGPIKITGEAQVAFGVTSNDFIWKRANFDLNEKFFSWRMLSNSGYNQGMNTYDPAVYDSLSVNLDTENEEGFNLHANITVDPWSFTGKSSKMTVSDGSDPVDVQLLYGANTNYTLNRTYYTSIYGNVLNLPEIKVVKGKAVATTISDAYGNLYNIPESDIDTNFQPIRELWLDYTNDIVKFRAFPMAYQDQAYTSDDPLNISNHGIWWKDSKWLRSYTPGVYHPGGIYGAATFTKGYWDDSLSFISKDSTGRYLTALRGFSFSLQPQEATTFDTTVATPKTLWQNYDDVDNVISASRLKHQFADNFVVGGTFTSRTGYTIDPQKLDSQNFVGGLDLSYELIEGVKAQAEVLTSQSKYDMTNSEYETESRGNAYYFSFITRYPRVSLMDLKYGYDEIALAKDEKFLVKSKFYAVRMDKGFDSSLSDFHNTRQDVFWSRHIHFRKPMSYYTDGLEGSGSNWSELNSTRIGDGIDVGRSTLGFRFEVFMEDRFINLFDIRNVHSVDGKFIENVVRDEVTVKITDKLTAKGMGIYQKLPKTVEGVDPYVYDGSTGEFFLNSAVPGGEDPSIETGSFGLNYDFFDWLSLNGIYEYTNDYTLAYGNFPQNLLRDDTSLYGRYYQNDKYYSYIQPFLYGQGIFPQAPYDFYNVFKTGLSIVPMKDMEIYIDYTRNEYNTASLINDNMNHIGMEITYMPTKKLGLSFKYIYSRCKDIVLVGDDYELTDDVVGHHNFFSEMRYMPSKDDEIIFQYGVGDTSSIGNMSSIDPYGGSMLTLDTQHIIRAYYRRRF